MMLCRGVIESSDLKIGNVLKKSLVGEGRILCRKDDVDAEREAGKELVANVLSEDQSSSQERAR